VGSQVVVALEGAVVPAGASPNDDDEAIVVKKTTVGGVKSSGMLCDCPLLAWTGGAKGVIVRLDPKEFPVGSLPPMERPKGSEK
jgi:hypothetical protein